MSSKQYKEQVSKGVSKESKIQAEEAPIEFFDMNNQLMVNPKLVEYLKKKNLAHRWVNATKLRTNHGFDARQWSPLNLNKVEDSSLIENNFFGTPDSEGYLRRGDMILCIRSKKLNDLVAERNTNKIKALAGDHRKATKEQLRKLQEEAGLSKNRIIEGYEDEGDEGFEEE